MRMRLSAMVPSRPAHVDWSYSKTERGRANGDRAGGRRDGQDGTILDGEVFLPAGAVGEPFVDGGDIADVVVEALTGTGQSGRVFELTGPRLLTFEQAIAEISAAAGRPIRYTQVSPDEFAAALKAEQVPPDLTWLTTYLFNEVLDGRNENLADGVREALSRPPREFADYAQATAATGVWTGG
jgi:uncharacterized protein YbjT (DUF2867 family)